MNTLSKKESQLFDLPSISPRFDEKIATQAAWLSFEKYPRTCLRKSVLILDCMQSGLKLTNRS